MKRISKIKILSNDKSRNNKNKLRIITAKPSTRSFRHPISKSENGLSPQIRLSLEHNANHHRISFNIISNSKPSKNEEIIKNYENNPEYEQELKIFNKISEFQELLFDNFQKHKYSLEENKKLNKENSTFLKQYKSITKKSQKNVIKFLDIKLAYAKKNYIVPELEGKRKNLFKSNILLNGESELIRFLSNGSTSIKNNNKCIEFLNRLNDLAYKKKIMLEQKIGLEKQSILLSQPSITNSQSIVKNNNNLKSLLKKIKNIQKDILKTKKTIQSIDEIDNFFSMDNKKYLTLLKYEKSLENINFSKLDGICSSRINSASADLVRINSGRNLSTNFTKEDEKIPSDKNSEKFQKVCSKLKAISPTSSLPNILKSPINSNSKRVKFKIENSSDKLLVNNENSRNRNLLKKLGGSHKNLKGNKKRIITSLKRKKFYDLLSRSSDTMDYQKEVKKYFLDSKGEKFVNIIYDKKNLLSPKISSRNFERIKFKMFAADLIKRDIQLRSREIYDDDKNRELKNKDNIFKNEMKYYQDKIAKIFCEKDI